MRSTFLNAYGNRIDQIIHEIDSTSMMSIPTGTVRLSEVSNILRGTKREIQELDRKKSELERINDELRKENERLKKLFDVSD